MNHQGNVQKVPFDKIEALHADIWLLSPPCQPYTRQGLQKGAQDARASSLWDLLDKFKDMQAPPKYVLLENVVGFEASLSRDQAVSTLKGRGFIVQECILSPHQLGIPYSRPRWVTYA